MYTDNKLLTEEGAAQFVETAKKLKKLYISRIFQCVVLLIGFFMFFFLDPGHEPLGFILFTSIFIFFTLAIGVSSVIRYINVRRTYEEVGTFANEMLIRIFLQKKQELSIDNPLIEEIDKAIDHLATKQRVKEIELEIDKPELGILLDIQRGDDKKSFLLSFYVNFIFYVLGVITPLLIGYLFKR